MNNFIPDYEPISLLGKGSFGYVFDAYDHINDIRVAIKRTHKVGKKLSREYEILSELKESKYIVKLIDIFYSIDSEGKVIQNLVFEYIKNTLNEYIDKFFQEKKFIPIEKIKKIFKQILLGLDDCHKKHIVHRDLKPENILLTDDEQIKLCDFGSAKYIYDHTISSPYIVSRFYRAPELILGKMDYNEKIDIFAAGCILAELFTLNPIFKGKEEGLQIFEYMCILGSPGKNYYNEFNIPKKYKDYFNKIKFNKIEDFDMILNKGSNYSKNDIKNAKDLILNMLNWDYNKRYSAEECLNHPFIKK